MVTVQSPADESRSVSAPAPLPPRRLRLSDSVALAPLRGSHSVAASPVESAVPLRGKSFRRARDNRSEVFDWRARPGLTSESHQRLCRTHRALVPVCHLRGSACLYENDRWHARSPDRRARQSFELQLESRERKSPRESELEYLLERKALRQALQLN